MTPFPAARDEVLRAIMRLATLCADGGADSESHAWVDLHDRARDLALQSEDRLIELRLEANRRRRLDVLKDGVPTRKLPALRVIEGGA